MKNVFNYEENSDVTNIDSSAATDSNNVYLNNQILCDNLGVEKLSKEDLLVFRTFAMEYKRDVAISSRIANIVEFLAQLEIDNINVEHTDLYKEHKKLEKSSQKRYK